MHLDFMTPQVWNGLVIGVTLIGAAFAILRLLRDWNLYQLRQRQSDRRSRSSAQDRSVPLQDDNKHQM